MKQMKKTVTILMLFAMLLSTCGIMASAFHVAVETEPVGPASILDDEIAPLRYERCEECPNGKVNYSHTAYSEWCTYTNNPCAHGDRRATDEEQERQITKFYACNNCTYKYYRNSKEFRTICHSKG